MVGHLARYWDNPSGQEKRHLRHAGCGPDVFVASDLTEQSWCALISLLRVAA